MPNRVSHSLLDPYLTIPVKRLYPRLRLPERLPPEAIVGLGHLCAIVSAVGWAYSTTVWWGGLVGALGIVLNHICDLFDGTHARATGQCRNGGELLDHFTDPLSFACILVGMSVAIGRLDIGLAAVIVLFATAVLTSIKAKITGRFELHACGPTEFKSLLTVLASAICVCFVSSGTGLAASVLQWSYIGMLVPFTIQLIITLIRDVREVNTLTASIDDMEWVTTRESKSSTA